MGQIRLNQQNGEVELVFYVGNGVKMVPKRRVIIEAATPQYITPVVEDVLGELRGQRTP